MMKNIVSFNVLILFFFVFISSSNGDGNFVFQNYFNINLTKIIDDDGGILLKIYTQINLDRTTEPENIAFDCKGKGLYVGISDERILKWKSNFGSQEFTTPSLFRKSCDNIRDSNFEPVCERPLGLKFDTRTCLLYIVDAYCGLLVVGLNGGTAIRLTISAKGAPFKFTNGLDIDASIGMDFLVTSTDRSGRMLRYNPHIGDVSVLYGELAFPNGVALNANNSFLLVNESIKNEF